MPDERYRWDALKGDVERPSAARVNDAYLGGDHNFAADRAFAAQSKHNLPHVADAARWNRTFLRSAVETMVAHGIDQFLDLGCGLPTMGSSHEVAQRHNPQARVVYVDIEPVAILHSRDLLRDVPGTGVVQADFLTPDEILGDPVTRELLDFTRPVGLLTFALLHFISDEHRPAEVLEQYKDVVVPGSHLAVSHITLDNVPEPVRSQMLRFIDSHQNNTVPELNLRGEGEIRRFFDGWQLLEPGVVFTSQWRSDMADLDVAASRPENAVCLAGVARKPDQPAPEGS